MPLRYWDDSDWMQNSRAETIVALLHAFSREPCSVSPMQVEPSEDRGTAVAAKGAD